VSVQLPDRQAGPHHRAGVVVLTEIFESDADLDRLLRDVAARTYRIT